MRKYKSLVFHIIGSTKEVVIASNEIYQYAREHYFTSKIIQNEQLFRELDHNVNQNVYINECNNLKCEEIKQIHHSLYHRFYRNPVFSYAIYVNQPPYFCPYIDSVYTLDEKRNDKNRILHSFLFGKPDPKYYYKR